MRNVPAAVALVAALALTLFAVARGTWAVGGSDSSCYGLMAEALAHADLQPPLALSNRDAALAADRAPWPDVALTLAPAGFIPSPVRRDAASPICTPGFSLVMVPFRWVAGRDGIFLVTPLAAGLLVWCAFIATRNLTDAPSGAAAAIVVAATPIVLFQATQPMNDITTAMLWTAAFASASRGGEPRALGIGMLTGLAVLVRPNLAPLAVVMAIWVATAGVAALVRFALAAAPATIVMLLFNAVLYGSPLRVGYGSAADLFSVSYLPTNVSHYGRALIETMTPFPLLAIAAPLVLATPLRGRAWLGCAMAGATCAVYLLYRPFDEWWYLRFLLPALVLLIVLATVALSRLVGRPAVVLIIAAGLAAYGIKTAQDRQAFDLGRLESRLRHGGEVVRDRLPANALVFAVFQSGTVRYHAQKQTVLWDSLDPEALTEAITWVRTQGFEPFLLLERWEEPAFRERFGQRSEFGALDWPPRIEVDRQVRIYSPADRAAYLSGHPVPTEHILPR